jgi:hypothetical protein
MNKRQRKKEKKKAVEARLKELRIEVVRTPSASHRRRGIEIRPTNHDRPPRFRPSRPSSASTNTAASWPASLKSIASG